MFSKFLQLGSAAARPRKMAGFTVVEMLVALIIGVALVSAGGHMYGKYQDNAANQNAAEHARMVAKAVRLYIHDHHNDIVNRINPQTQKLVLGLDEIQRAGYGKGIAPTNVFGQSYTIGIRKNVNTAMNQINLDTLIVTSGGHQPIDDNHLLSISQKIGADGGAIRHATPGSVQGAFRGWDADPRDYGINNAQAGGVAVGLFVVSNGAAGTGNGNHNRDVLHRVKVNGKPELNAMANAPLKIATGEAVGLRNYEGNSNTDHCKQNDQTTWGNLIVNTDGTLLSCRSGRWLKASEGQWKDSVADYANSLVAVRGNVGDVRIAQNGDSVTHHPRAYTWHQTTASNGKWVPVSIDHKGDMQVPNQLVVGSAIKLPSAGAACDPAQANLAVNTQGNVVVCKGRSWVEVATK